MQKHDFFKWLNLISVKPVRIIQQNKQKLHETIFLSPNFSIMLGNSIVHRDESITLLNNQYPYLLFDLHSTFLPPPHVTLQSLPKKILTPSYSSRSSTLMEMFFTSFETQSTFMFWLPPSLYKFNLSVHN